MEREMNTADMSDTSRKQDVQHSSVQRQEYLPNRLSLDMIIHTIRPQHQHPSHTGYPLTTNESLYSSIPLHPQTQPNPALKLSHHPSHSTTVPNPPSPCHTHTSTRRTLQMHKGRAQSTRVTSPESYPLIWLMDVQYVLQGTRKGIRRVFTWPFKRRG